MGTTKLQFVIAPQEMTGECNPVRILIDFKKTAIITSTKIFPSSAVKNCYFQIRQNSSRKTGDSGLQKIYGNNWDFAFPLKMVPVLASSPKITLSQALIS